MTRLLDVNVLMALLWEDHEHNERAARWFNAIQQFATYPIAQLGFVRISSHSSGGYGLRPEQAFALLRRLLSDARHRFVPDDLNCDERALLTESITGAKQITDHYLVALARRYRMLFSTFDIALSRAFPGEADLVELIP